MSSLTNYRLVLERFDFPSAEATAIDLLKSHPEVWILDSASGTLYIWAMVDKSDDFGNQWREPECVMSGPESSVLRDLGYTT